MSQIYYLDGKWRLDQGMSNPNYDKVVDPMPGDRISKTPDNGWRMSLYCHELTVINNCVVAKCQDYTVKITDTGENVFIRVEGNGGLYIHSVAVERLDPQADNETKAGFNADISEPFVDLLSYVVNRFGYKKEK